MLKMMPASAEHAELPAGTDTTERTEDAGLACKLILRLMPHRRSVRLAPARLWLDR